MTSASREHCRRTMHPENSPSCVLMGVMQAYIKHSHQLTVPYQIGGLHMVVVRLFAVFGPSTYNSLPKRLRDPFCRSIGCLFN